MPRLIELPRFEYTTLEDLPPQVAQASESLGKVLTADGSIVGTASLLLVGGQTFAVAALHSFGKQFQGRKIVFPWGDEIEITEKSLNAADQKLGKLDILALPYSESPSAPLKPSRGRGRFKVGIITAHLGFPEVYLRERSLTGPVASVGEIRNPTWDNPGKLVTKAPMEIGQSGAPLLDVKQGLVGGIVIGGERLKALPGQPGVKRFVTLAVHINELLSALER